MSSLDVVLRICLCGFLCLAVKGKEYARVHCISSNKPLQLANPFKESWYDKPDFYTLEWSFIGFGSGKKQVLMDMRANNPKYLRTTRWKIFGDVGIQVREPTFSDSGMYRAEIVRKFYGYKKVKNTFEIKVTVAEAPTLQSKSLAVRHHVDNHTGETTLVCGTLSDEGFPPVDVEWEGVNKADPSSIRSSQVDGNFILFVGNNTQDANVSCALEMSPAVECIPPDDLKLFGLPYVRKKPPSSKNKGMSAGSKAALGGAGGLAALLGLSSVVKKSPGTSGRRRRRRYHGGESHHGDPIDAYKDDEVQEGSAHDSIVEVEAEHSDGV